MRPELEVLVLRRQVAQLQQALTEMRRFQAAVWSSAISGLERWAQREGLPLDGQPAPSARLLSQEVRTALEMTDEPDGGAPPAPVARPPRGSARLRLERRTAARHQVQWVVRFAAPGLQRTVIAMLVEVSRGALVLHSPYAVPPETRVACGLYVERDRACELVLIKGRVVRALAADDARGPGFVVQIEEMTSEAERFVDDLLGAASPGAIAIEPHHVRGDESTARIRSRTGRIDATG